MLELITTPLTIISVIAIVGIFVDGFQRGIDNLSRSEEIIFFIALAVLLFILFI